MNTLSHKDYNSKEKTLIKEEIFWKSQDDQPIWKDIKHIEFQDKDEIAINYSDDSYDHNDHCWVISVTRWVEETDEKFEKRLKMLEEEKERRRKMRYESYLKLKAEFENESITK